MGEEKKELSRERERERERKESMTDRRKIREKYRELKVLSEENEDSVHWATTGKLEEILLTANKLHERVEKPREHAADTELLQQSAASGLSAAKLSFHAGK